VSPLELVLVGAACYLFGLVSGAVVIPCSWTGDSSRSAGMGDERRPDADYRWARQVAALLLILTPRGLPVSQSWLTQHFQDLPAAAGLPKMRLYDLRHGAATLLLGAGVHPRVAQQLLRHASSKTTTEIYSHVTAAQERQAAEVLETALVG
jgi:integrase